MRFLAPLLPLSALLVCQCNASVSTTGGSSGPQAPPTSTATPAAAVKPAKPPRPETKAGCDACNGQWAKHGISETETCICKTKDGGKSCKDGSECDGVCVLADDAKFEVTAPGSPPRGGFTGKCSEYDTVFGCFRSIPSGTRAKGPVTEDEGSHRICVD